VVQFVAETITQVCHGLAVYLDGAGLVGGILDKELGKHTHTGPYLKDSDLLVVICRNDPLQRACYLLRNLEVFQKVLPELLFRPYISHYPEVDRPYYCLILTFFTQSVAQVKIFL